MKCKSAILLLLFLFFLKTATKAQSNVRFQNFTIDNGLSQSSVSDIVQDNAGFLWVCTQDGLNRFDGYHFKVFNADITNGIESNFFNCGIKSSDGMLWFGTQFGLVFYNPILEQFTSYYPGNELPNKTIKSIVENEDGNIVCSFENKGLYVFDIVSKKFTPLTKQTLNKDFSNVYFHKKIGVIACSNSSKKIYVIKRKEVSEILIYDKDSALVVPTTITYYNPNGFLIGTKKGLYKWNVIDHSVQRFSQKVIQKYGDISVQDAVFFSDKYLFVASESQGLFELKFEHDTIASVQQYKQDIFQESTLLNNQTNRLFIDSKQQLWVCTESGLSAFDPNYLGFMGIGPSGNLELGLPSPNVWSFVETENGNKIYIGTSSGVSMFNKITGTFSHYFRDKVSGKNRKTDIPVLTILPIRQNVFLVGCIDGLYKLTVNKKNYQFTAIYHKNAVGEDYNRIYKILQCDAFHYWIATGGGLCKLDVRNNTFQYIKSAVYYGSVKMICKDLEGNLLLAPASGGIYQCLNQKNGTYDIRPLSFNRHLLKITKSAINTIYQKDPFTLWLGTYGKGLIKVNLKENTIMQYDQSDGLPNNVVYGILGDKQNNLWLSTNRGLSKFNIQDAIFTNYSEKDGLMSNEFNIGAYIQSQSGQLYFGCINGYTYFFPKKLKKQQVDLSIFFTSISTGNEAIKPGQKNNVLTQSIAFTSTVALSYKDRNISIEFATNNLSNASRVEYRYILAGNDKDFNYIGTENSIHFTSLSPGEYKLKIYSKSIYGGWSDVPAILTINVLPPFWFTWWFITIVVLLIILLAFAYYKYRKEKHRRRLVRLEMRIIERTKEIREQNEEIEEKNKQIQLQNKKLEEQKEQLEIEKEKVDQLLHNILPEDTANELKNRGSTKARAYNRVSVMFTDFIGFTTIAQSLAPMELLQRLDQYFSKFDEIIGKWNLEKIKTVGDAYLCAGGMPIRTKENPIQTVLAALEIQQYMKEQAKIDRKNKIDPWNLRLGINTGEVIAGVVGKKRFAYDIWGSTVNLAQRMEANGKQGKVNVSESTYEVIQPYFECTLRGEVMTKNSGMVNMYFVDRIKPTLSADKIGLEPNDRFWKIVELHIYSAINYMKAERTIMNLLEEKLPPNLHYHSIAHTKDVCAAAERIALLEGITDEDLFLLKSAATYHDAGFVEQYDKNEPIGVRLAQEHLPKHGYSDDQIKIIENLIYATQIPHNPKTKLEEIICDSDLDYLGRDDFHEIADKLRLELKENDKIKSDRGWDEIQVKFLTQHKYFTKSAIKLRQKKKMQNLEEIKQRLKEFNYAD